ncbi:MAG TPA: hypothetical protein VNH13_10855 [Candidatus Acidoferrales bacterium]|nr:hypothetical protein [Candidatus Acidoferrales bacterium]
MDSVAARFRTRLLPALLLALGVALVGNGLLSFTTAVEPAPVAEALESYVPLPTIDAGISLPGGGGNGGTEASFPPDRVATRVVIRRLNIDLPVIAQPPEAGVFPLCDVALYFTALGQPGSGRATYIYAHARRGMFLPLLTASQDNGGARILGYLVEVYTSDNFEFLYTISEVKRHQRDLAEAFADTQGRLWLQTSEGPNDSYPKLQVVADFQSMSPADPNAAHPDAQPRQCQ